MEIGGNLMSRDWTFYSVEWGQGPGVRASRVFCGRNLAGRGPRGGAWPLVRFKGLTDTVNTSPESLSFYILTSSVSGSSCPTLL